MSNYLLISFNKNQQKHKVIKIKPVKSRSNKAFNKKTHHEISLLKIHISYNIIHFKNKKSSKLSLTAFTIVM